MDTIQIDLSLKGGSVYATFEIVEPGMTLQDVEKLLVGLCNSIWNFESFEEDDECPEK